MAALTTEAITALLDEWLETEFTFIKAEPIARTLATLPPIHQPLILDLVRRVASTHVEVAHQFAIRCHHALALLEPLGVKAWAMHAADCYDRSGLAAALDVIRDVEGYFDRAREQAFGALLDEYRGVLTSFLHGLSGRKLKVEASDAAWTDGETLFLPRVLVALEDKEANFTLYKAMVGHLWAQTRFGTFRVPLTESFSHFADPARAAGLFHAFETLRLDACLLRELPGLHRRMQALRQQMGQANIPRAWHETTEALKSPEATAWDSLTAVARHYGDPLSTPACYQGEFRPQAIEACLAARLERERVLIRVRLRTLLDELARDGLERHENDRFEWRRRPSSAQPDDLSVELWLDGKPLSPPEDVAAMLGSVMLDLGEIPDEYLHPAGPGEFDISRYQPSAIDVDDVWSGTYHEEGAFLYNEWDHQRCHYRKSWCVVREHQVRAGSTTFYDATLAKHRFIIGQLRRAFEVLRGEDRLQKRQAQGDDVDIDALVDTLADMRSGLEQSERLFTRRHREERSIAVLFMVDMSGSTKGWVNEAEREALILLGEALEILGDRYAIYGFSGWGRKRCEVFRIKGFDEPLRDEVKGRICAIEARDYTRMGPAIRHLTHRLSEVTARVKLLVTLSDGKPDDYDAQYRGKYGIEDTRMALFEARREGIHPFCITIDKQGQDYLPHMYGAANYTVIDQVERLPFKVSDIYRKITG